MLLPMRQIFQEMAAEKLRLGLTILAVAWATLCIAAMLAVGEGIRQGVLRTAQDGNGNLIYLTGGMATVDYGVFHQGKFLTLKADDTEVIKALPEVKSVAPTAVWDERITVGDRGIWQKPLAVTTDFASMTNLIPMDGGRWLNPLDQKEMRKVVVLGYSLAADLFNPIEDFSWFTPVTLQTNPVGEKVKIGSEEFTVIGVLKKNSAEIEQGDQINYASFVPLATWQRFYTNGDIGGINVEPQAHADREKLAKTIRQVIARKHGASVSDEQVVQVEDMFLKQKSMQQFLIGLQSFLGIIGFVTLAVAGVGIANVMYATVKRSTRDIGVRMAVGATPTAIRLHYLVQSLMTMILGGLLGLGVTYTLVSAISAINLEGNTFYEHLGKPVPELSWIVVAIVISTLVFIGVASAWLPANRAAKVSPLEALQSE
ncbi:ABC-type antimicrobial peptide transport system, permease component [Vibrio chagasii]|uniref:ABC transporter permease n=1 Tax=Vibrio TaxID=662 RepID=UPI001493BC6D|nr:ABC transporter permease [Vibrio sp. 99K-1]CAH7320699.1 ABC-type antimicrobial peptide transport system, permease component [Vibrio chagasii]NOI83965.1 ABC transporter permease [Vibrio sp. 99K-1]CAH7349542.1 ABC-type antimicrobial peptide transport system, permease component [Vibrio chagasii]CAH7418323.1 ABC-type antimicrobial peptide transport system, permease component [Vibrio chagasii]CAH7479582.1 ABC-type antimicrobial peptide transport system, permease component [Vibrio chagasii]